MEKKIIYKEIIQFLLPDIWIIEEDLDGDLLHMYTDQDDTSTFRLSLVQAKNRKILNKNNYLELFQFYNFYNGEKIDILEKGYGVTTTINNYIENDIKIIVFNWLMANIKYSNVVQLANFSFTTLHSNTDKMETLSTIGMLDNEIRRSQFL